MIPRFLVCLAFFALASHSPSAMAFKLNPCLRILTFSEVGLGQRPINSWNPCYVAPEKYQLAVHEHMTIASIDMYRGLRQRWSRASGIEAVELNYMKEKSWAIGDGPRHETFGLVFGTWWNDDPMMYLWGQGSDFVSGVKHLRRLFSSSQRNNYEGGVEGCQVPAGQHLARSSHFAELQHLHFMTALGKEHPDQERLKGTIADGLTWIKFAYQVATNKIKPDEPLTVEDERLLKLPSIAKNLCLQNPSNVKVRSLFTRQGPVSAKYLDFRNRLTRDVALGSILHILQDSFSPAHTCRIELHSNGETVAALRTVFNYNEQDHKHHASRDGYPDWLVHQVRTGSHRYSNDPVSVGAWLLGAVDRSLPWEDVQKHLESTIFLLAPEGQSGSCI